MEKIFQEGTRSKIRFATSKGLLSIEEIWDLPLTSKNDDPNLDDLAIMLHKELREKDEISFVKTPAKANHVTRLQFEIVKAIIEVKIAEREAAKDLAVRNDKKAKIMDILARKKDQALEQASEEDLQKMLNEL